MNIREAAAIMLIMATCVAIAMGLDHLTHFGAVDAAAVAGRGCPR